MTQLPTKKAQIIQAHAALIVAVVKAVHNPALLAELQETLETARQNGWAELVKAIVRIVDGARDQSLLAGLDEEDTVIVEAILNGIQNPQSLPDPQRRADPVFAAPGLAQMIHSAGRGNVQTLQILADMSTQMARVGGDMAKLGGIMRRLINGERNADELSRGMSAQGVSLVASILEELGKLEIH